MKILLMNIQIAKPDRASGCKRLYGMMEIMSKKHEIVYFSASKKIGSENYIRLLEDLGIRVINGNHLELLSSLLKETFDLCFYEFYFIGHKYLDLVKALQPNSLTVVDSVDIHFGRVKKALQLGLVDNDDYLKKKKKELETYRKADLTIVVSEEDGVLLNEESIKNWSVISNIVPTKPRLKIERNEQIITFVGAFGHTPNIHAIEWFLNDVWHLIKRDLPEVVFKVAGPNLPNKLQERINNLKDVKYLGFVPDLSELYNETQVVVAPLTYGGGVKGKVNEAMANGIPLVSTSIGVQGIPAIDGEHCFIADASDDFASKVVKLMIDKRLQSEFSQNSQKLAVSTCGVDNAIKQIEKTFSLLGLTNKDLKTLTLVGKCISVLHFAILLPQKLIQHSMERFQILIKKVFGKAT